MPAAVTAREDVLAADFALQIQNRHQSAADQVAAAQVRIGRILDARSTPATIAVGDLVWMDGAYLPHQIPSKLANKWFGPYRVLSVHVVAVRLDLPAALGKVSNLVNMRSLKFFELRDSVFGESDLPLEPLRAGDGVQRWEVRRILGQRLHKQREEMYVEWAGYDQSWVSWVHRDSLLADVPALVAAYDATPSAFQARGAQAGHEGSATAGAPSACSVACLGSAAGGERLGVDAERGRAVGGLRAAVAAQSFGRVFSRLQVWSSVTKG